ncbi:MAG: type II secretion system secretin GspD, partial [Gallionella sp.]
MSVSSVFYAPLLHAQEKGSLNFVDADIESVIAAVGEYTNTTFIVDPRVKGTLSLASEKPLSKSQAFKLLASVLRMRGYSIVSGPGYSKVVPEADAKLQATPLQTGSIRGDQIATQIFRLNYESANNLVSVLRPLISPNNTISANPGSNSLVITDYADNLLRLGKIISALDGPENSEPEFVPVKHGIASDIAATVSRLLESGATNGRTSAQVSLLTDPRSNTIIIQASTAVRTEQVKSLIAKLDQPTANPGNVHVVYLKNAEATKLAKTLRAVMSFDTSAITSSPSTSSSAAKTQKTALPSGGAAGFIQADPTTNTLIITASEPVYRNMRAVIDQLDARRAQVYIESLIVEVTATRAAEFGVQWGSVSGDSTSDYRIGGLTSFGNGGDNLAALASGDGALLPGAGLSLGIFRQINGEVGLGALARALASDDSANILSMPNLLTLDNEEAEIIVGQNVPFVTGQFTTSASGGSAGVNPFQTIERQD